MIRFGEAPYLECSSKGDRRFSAFYARPSMCKGQSIEEAYQAAKVFSDGSTGLSWQQAKGRVCVNRIPVRKLYSKLWRAYIKEHPELLRVLQAASGLSDIFGRTGSACQAEELWAIRTKASRVAAKAGRVQ